MAQSAMDGGGGTSYAPDWIKNTGGVDTSQGYGGIGQLGKEYDPANWGPAPPPGMAGKGPWGADDPNGKFWSNGGILDDRANTMNWRLLGDVPGNYMQNGTLISAAKRYYDLHRPISDPITAGSFRPAPQFGPGMYWSTTGELGYPGQLSNFATMWGAGGPGSG
jgi:hypothetical protein